LAGNGLSCDAAHVPAAQYFVDLTNLGLLEHLFIRHRDRTFLSVRFAKLLAAAISLISRLGKAFMFGDALISFSNITKASGP
jgi:hypothetical protein